MHCLQLIITLLPCESVFQRQYHPGTSGGVDILLLPLTSACLFLCLSQLSPTSGRTGGVLPCPIQVQMSSVQRVYLPSELVHAVLIRLDDFDWYRNKAIKRGLASCSLTCRHWAVLIRPMLFMHLTLSSGEDVSQLVAFLNADFLEPTLGYCILSLRFIEDQASAGPSWGHQLIRLAERLPRCSFRTCTVKGAPAVPDSQQPLACRSPLPFSTLPRTLFRSRMHQFTQLTLSGLSLRSVQDLANFVAHQMSCERLALDNVTFAEETAGEIRLRRVPASRSVLEWIHVSHTFQDRDTVQRWMKTSSILFASQGLVPPGDITLALVESYLHVLLSHSGREDPIQHLGILRHGLNEGECFHPKLSD